VISNEEHGIMMVLMRSEINPLRLSALAPTTGFSASVHVLVKYISYTLHILPNLTFYIICQVISDKNLKLHQYMQISQFSLCDALVSLPRVPDFRMTI
jgi:hypothetical protein